MKEPETRTVFAGVDGRAEVQLPDWYAEKRDVDDLALYSIARRLDVDVYSVARERTVPEPFTPDELDTHAWAQSIGGFPIAIAVELAVRHLQVSPSPVSETV